MIRTADSATTALRKLNEHGAIAEAQEQHKDNENEDRDENIGEDEGDS